jgi:hypothetical protein
MTRTFPSIVGAMSDPRLFGPMFSGPSWNNWKVVLRGAFGLAMSPAEIEFFRVVTGREPPGKRVKELDIVAGRRSGKDSVASMIACYAAITFRPNGKVRPGERPLVMLLGADRPQASPREHSGLRTFAAPAQEGRDAVRSSQTHPQAWPPQIARPQQRPR